MTQSPGSGGRSIDRFSEALRSLDDRVQELRGRFDDQRHKIDDEFQKRRQQIEEQVRTTPFFKQLAWARKEIEHQLERVRDQLFENLGIATRQDLDKLQRKVDLLARRLGELSRDPRER